MVRTCPGARPLSLPALACAMRSSRRFQSSCRRAMNSSDLMSGSQNNPVRQPLPDTDLVVSTPERVSFDYQVAGLGTRGIAQILDLLIVTGLLVAVFFFAAAAAAATRSDVVGTLIDLFGAFVVIFGYFWISEAIFSGQTLGKRALRLRVVGDRGEPLTWVQAGIRNVIRIVDFLPYGYGVGVVVLFANGRGKRLGDLAAGTIVVKDSDHVWLWQLARATRSAPPPPPPPPGSPPVAMPYAPASQAELILRRIDPDLRRFDVVCTPQAAAAPRPTGSARSHGPGQPAHGAARCLRGGRAAGSARSACRPGQSVEPGPHLLFGDVPAGQDDRHPLAGEVFPPLCDRCDSGGAGRLDDEACAAMHEAHRVDDLIVRHQHHVVDRLAHDLERFLHGHPDGDSVGDRVHGRSADGPACAP